MSYSIENVTFQEFYSDLCRISPLFEEKEIQLLVSDRKFRCKSFPEKVLKVMEMAKRTLHRNFQVEAADLQEDPKKYFVEQMRHKAQWLEETRLALSTGGKTYSQWLYFVWNSVPHVYPVPEVFRTHELCVAALSRCRLSKVWVPTELLKDADISQFLT